MFLRFTSRTNADGAVVRYVALAHNRRVDGRVKPDVLMSLGRVDQVDVAGLQRLAASINKHFGGCDELTGAAPPGAAGRTASSEVVDVRAIGVTWLLDGVWHRLDVGAALRAAIGARRFTADLERVLFALVAHRAVAPMSGLSAAEWVREEAAVPGLSTMDDEHARRAMDLLENADTQARVQESLFRAVPDRLDPLFFNTIHFACDGGEQIVVGLAMTKEGIPVRCWCWPGGAGDDPVPAEVRDLLDRHPGRVVTVVERGFSSVDDLARLRRAGGHYLAGMRMRDGNRLVEAVLSRPGRYRYVRDNLRIREVRLDGQDARFVVCHDSDQARRDHRQRDETIVHIQAELARIADRCARNEAARVRAECALLDHPTLGRWLIRPPDGRLKVDPAKVKAEARLDGKYVIATSDPHISAQDVTLGYKHLLNARDLKTQLLTGPAGHRSEHRIRAHVQIRWLALLLTRVAEHASGQTWQTINRQLGRVAQVTLAGPAGSVAQTTPLCPEQTAIYQALSIQPPARVTASSPGRRGARGRSR
ncbi:IS1634 family transposase [Dactylosporangium salmoneum]|uniref:Transposase n=1 Tax=Dactylosporangium salmoneum TaxID=53361 RepID=A0ABP5TDV1_9ACTN